MSAPSCSRQPGWQPGHIPKLSYRRAIPPEEMEAIQRSGSCYQQSRRDETQQISTSAKESKQISIREIRKSLPENRASNKSTTNHELKPDLSRSAKKKSSLFAGLFAKEPTMAALAQVEADLVTKHGAATPQAVPHVSSRKLPEHVPKVNSKWDGLPENLNGKDEERSRWASIARSHSMEATLRTAVASYRPRAERSSSSRYSENSRNGRTQRFYTESSSSSLSADLSRASETGATSIKSQSLRSPSGTSLPEITYFFPTKDENCAMPAVPRRERSMTGLKTKSMSSGNSSRHGSEAGQQYQGPAAEAMPEHSSSPIATPGEASPVTPGFLLEPSERTSVPTVLHDSSKVSGTKATEQLRKIVPVDAFLAGEARPLELPDNKGYEDTWSDLPFRRKNSISVARVQQDIAKRPDSSRQRLGLRAIKVVGDDETPWKANRSQSMPTSPNGPSHLQKKRSKKFGLLKV